MTASGGYVLRANEAPYCVYVHQHAGRVFYIGSGSLGRPFQRTSRTDRWQAYVSGLETYVVRIVETFPTKEAARAEEARLIALVQPVCNVVGTTFESDKHWPEPPPVGMRPPTVEAYRKVLHALAASRAENAVLRQAPVYASMSFWQRVRWWCTGAVPSRKKGGGGAPGALGGAPQIIHHFSTE